MMSIRPVVVVVVVFVFLQSRIGIALHCVSRYRSFLPLLILGVEVSRRTSDFGGRRLPLLFSLGVNAMAVDAEVHRFVQLCALPLVHSLDPHLQGEGTPHFLAERVLQKGVRMHRLVGQIQLMLLFCLFRGVCVRIRVRVKV